MKDEEAKLNSGLGFVGWFLGIDSFLLGILLTNYHNIGIKFRIPIFFLVCSLAGLIISARIYRDASGSTEYASHIGINARKMFEFGNIISEFIGINLLVFSIPLMVCLLIDDQIIQLATVLIVVGSFMIYYATEYTIAARRYRAWVRVPFALLVGIPLIIASLSSDTSLFYLAVIPLIISILITIHSIIFLQYKEI